MTHQATLNIMNACRELGLASEAECQAATKLVLPGTPFKNLLAAAESLHVHIKVDDTSRLDRDALARLGGKADFEKAGFVKFRFPGGARIIFSSINISQDDLARDSAPLPPRPFVDHFGVDLRAEDDAARKLFDNVPKQARNFCWAHVPQGGDGAAVHCCHTEVKAKHWVYPASDWDPCEIPIEVAFGELATNADASGCDLRPMHPAKQRALGAEINPCCG